MRNALETATCSKNERVGSGGFHGVLTRLESRLRFRSSWLRADTRGTDQIEVSLTTVSSSWSVRWRHPCHIAVDSSGYVSTYLRTCARTCASTWGGGGGFFGFALICYKSAQSAPCLFPPDNTALTSVPCENLQSHVVHGRFT